MIYKKPILIYKRTHCGDPDPETGEFGNNDCMGQIRGWCFDAVIGVGGVGEEPQQNGIARKVTWIGVGAHKREVADKFGPLVTFDHFLNYGKRGPLLETLAPSLAARIYERNIRSIISTSLPEKERLEAEEILYLALNAPPSAKCASKARLDFIKASASSSCCRSLPSKKKTGKNLSSRNRCRSK
jgi:hypothetical protein